MSFGLLKKTKPEKVQEESQGRQPQISSRRQRLQPRELWANFNEGEVDCYHLTNQPTIESPRRQRRAREEKVERRTQESSLRRMQSRQEREEEELDYYSRGRRASNQIGRKPRDEEATYYYHRDGNSSQENQRKLRQTREAQPKSKPKVFSKFYTASQVAKEAEVVSESLSSSVEHVEIQQDQIMLKERHIESSSTSPLDLQPETSSSSLSSLDLQQREFCSDQLLLESKNEEAMKKSLWSTDDSADALTHRYPLMPTPDSYSLEFKVVEEVDFVFGDSAFTKPGNNVKSLMAEIMKSSMEKQLLHFWRSKTEQVPNIEGEKNKDFKLFEEREVANPITLDKCKFLKVIGAVTTAQRRGPIMDKVRDGRRVIETTILDYYGVPEKPNERILSLYLEAGVVFKQKKHEARSTLQGSISGGLIMLPRVSYLQFMKDFNHPFDPGIQI